MKRLAITRIAPSASAERCSAFPCPYWWPVSAGRAATPTAKNVRSAAIRSVPECAASETRPRLCVARPVPSFKPIRAIATSTETSAVRRCGVTGAAYARLRLADRLERPDEHVLSAREMADGYAFEHDRRNRHELDRRLGGLQWPQLVMDVRAMEPAPGVGRVEAVAFDQKPLERSRLGMKDGAGGAIAAAEHAAGLIDACALVIGPLATLHRRHARVEVREPVHPSRHFYSQPARGVEAEEPDARPAVAAVHIGAYVQFQELGDARERQRSPCAQAGQPEWGDADPRTVVERLDLEACRHLLANVG